MLPDVPGAPGARSPSPCWPSWVPWHWVPSLGLDLIPQPGPGRFEMTVKLAPGTALVVDTDALVRDPQGTRQDPAIASIYGVAGVSTPASMPAKTDPNRENIARLLVAPEAGRWRQGETRPWMRCDARAATRAARSSSRVRRFFSPRRWRSYDSWLRPRGALDKGGQKLIRFAQCLAAPPDVEVRPTGYPRSRSAFDQDRAAALGLTTRQIADQVVKKVRGEVCHAPQLPRPTRSTCWCAPGDRASVEGHPEPHRQRGRCGRCPCGSQGGCRTRPGGGRRGASASVRGGGRGGDAGPSEIHRISQERVAAVSANPHYGDLGSAVAEVRDLLAKNPAGRGRRGAHRRAERRAGCSVRSLLFALGWPSSSSTWSWLRSSESLLHPFVIMFSIPLAAVGGARAEADRIARLGRGFLGLIMLVASWSNAIVLIDRVNRLREAGVEKRVALVQAAESRLRPIVMTTLCTPDRLLAAGHRPRRRRRGARHRWPSR